jgi:hypothetical protein
MRKAEASLPGRLQPPTGQQMQLTGFTLLYFTQQQQRKLQKRRIK